jgi:hypothetical protein
VALVLIALSVGLLALSAIGYLSRRRDWRAKLVEVEASQSSQEKT